MRNAWALLVATLLMFSAIQAHAQTPPVFPKAVELDRLFARLQDPDVGSDALRIEPQIWDIWLHEGSDAENEALAKATQTMNIGDFKTADKMMSALVTRSPNFAEAWNKRATLYYLMRRYDDSLADIVKTLDLEPRHFGALSGRGMIYQSQGRDGDALSAYKDALSVNPTLRGARIAVQELQKKLPEL